MGVWPMCMMGMRPTMKAPRRRRLVARARTVVGVAGLVTMEDILEEIVGSIEDEHDIAVSGVRPQTDGTYVISGTVTLRDLNREFEWHLPDDQAATLAGLLLHASRRIPESGQVFTFYGYRFQILRRHRNQITSIRVTPPAPVSDDN